MNPKVDWSGKKYIIAQELGESIDIFFVKYNKNHKKFEFYKRPHSEYDGVGAFCDILEKLGHEVEKIPFQNIGKTPGRWEKFRLLKKFLKKSSIEKPDWKLDVNFKLSGVSEGCCVAFLSKEQTSQVLLKKKRILSSFLINSLDKATCSDFVHGNIDRGWILPINMRGGPIKDRYYGNAACSVTLHLNGKTQDLDIQQELMEYLKEGLHWGSWVYTNMPKYISTKVLKVFFKKMENRGYGYLAHLGTMPTKKFKMNEEIDDIDDLWTTISIPSKVVPIASGSMIWRDQLCLSLRFHPSLKLDLEDTKKYLNLWMENILSVAEDKKSPEVLCIREKDMNP